jgi:site-specific recombinase XerD
MTSTPAAALDPRPPTVWISPPRRRGRWRPRLRCGGLRAIQDHPAPRDRVLALLPFYAGLRIAEAVGLDIDDVRLSARKGTLRVHGKGGTLRELPIHPQLRTDLQLWLDERPDWPGAHTSPALLLNHRGTRLSTRGASTIFRTIATTAGLDDTITAHTGRHTFATTLVGPGLPKLRPAANWAGVVPHRAVG